MNLGFPNLIAGSVSKRDSKFFQVSVTYGKDTTTISKFLLITELIPNRRFQKCESLQFVDRKWSNSLYSCYKLFSVFNYRVMLATNRILRVWFRANLILAVKCYFRIEIASLRQSFWLLSLFSYYWAKQTLNNILVLIRMLYFVN